MQTQESKKKALHQFGVTDENGNFKNNKNEEKFFNGQPLVAFERNKRLEISQLPNGDLFAIGEEFDKNIENLLRDARLKPDLIQYSQSTTLISTHDIKSRYSAKAFIYDKEKDTIKEYDVIHNHKELSEEIDKKENPGYEKNRLMDALETLKGMLQFKMHQYPEIAKVIQRDINIVSEVMDTTTPVVQQDKQTDTEVRLDVNDRDLFEDANYNREDREQNGSHEISL